MTVSIHQPHFLPWLGYFNKVLKSDIFVWLNTVQYRERYYQNRCKIKNQDSWMWLTLPVHADRNTLIDEVRIAEVGWQTRIKTSLQRNYARSPFFAACSGALFDAMDRSSDSLDGVNYGLFVTLMQMLDSRGVRIVRADELPIESHDPTGRLVETCQALGGRTYLAGRGGHNYMDVLQFERAGIRVVWQDFDFNSVSYPQPDGKFVPGLSIVDCLFNN